MKSLVIGIAGGTGAGKTTICNSIINNFGENNTVYLASDSYYKDMAHIPFEKRGEVNLDHPNALEMNLLAEHIKSLVNGEAIDVPIFDFVARQRTMKVKNLNPRPIILVDGILLLAVEQVRDTLDIKVFLEEDADIRFIRRLTRDTVERGRTMESTIKQYLSTVRPMHNELVDTTKYYADLIGRSDETTINQICKIISDRISSSEK